MKEIYIARDPLNANVVKGLLEEQGIPATVQGEFVYSLHGTAGVMYPSVWVLSDDDFDRAEEIVRDFEARVGQRKTDTWQCRQCGEILEEQFTECWRCGTSRSVAP